MDYQPLQIFPAIQHYAWGKPGSSSIIRHLAPQIDLTKPCAELWYGAHPKGSARCTDSANGIALADNIMRDPEGMLGRTIAEHYKATLPFLLKVLAIGQPLSIQAHPDLALAKSLHERDPQNYPDQNHKPEIAIALTDFTALAGFRPITSMRSLVVQVPEFSLLVPAETLQRFHASETPAAEAVKLLWSALMTAKPAEIEAASQALYRRLAATKPNEFLHAILALEPLYPKGDCGLFCFFMLNYFYLRPGEGLFLSANTPHAYLSGEIVECMANSDNVVRAGFTEKFKDVPTLLSMLDYEAPPPAVLTPKDNSGTYATPAREFSIQCLHASTGTRVLVEGGPRIVLSTTGTGQLAWGNSEYHEIHPGSAFFIPDQSVKIQLTLMSGDTFIASTP